MPRICEVSIFDIFFVLCAEKEGVPLGVKIGLCRASARLDLIACKVFLEI